MHSSKINDSNGTYTDPNTGVVSKGTYNYAKCINELMKMSDMTFQTTFSFAARNLQAPAQNCNYCPAAVFITGAEQNARKLLGNKFDYREFATVAIIDAVQPATISGMAASVDLWIKKKLAN
jgi:uncharacterized protein (DUF885 family)